MSGQKKTPVAIFIGSTSDLDKIKPATSCLKNFSIDYLAYIISAHRGPELLEEKVKQLGDHQVQVIIAAAGMSAHLAGVIASKTWQPVIGLPLSGGFLGLDALLSMTQMPSQIPVATVAIDGAVNAAMLAVQILASNDNNLKEKIIKHRKELANSFNKLNQGQAF
ncbi:MAG: 5-(carboxyamino)imidazole ribonucleotide mutase [SAR324 cluster bacterium]|nr:5-(carboxyamino)imidazole ribonucleotide mutase [SAR324 cluster bacterium]